MSLDFIHHTKGFGDLDVERGLGTEKDVAVRVGGFVTVIHQLCVGAYFAVITANKLEKAQNTALINGAEDKGGCCAQQVLFDVFAEANESLLEVLPPGLADYARC